MNSLPGKPVADIGVDEVEGQANGEQGNSHLDSSLNEKWPAEESRGWEELRLFKRGLQKTHRCEFRFLSL